MCNLQTFQYSPLLSPYYPKPIINLQQSILNLKVKPQTNNICTEIPSQETTHHGNPARDRGIPSAEPGIRGIPRKWRVPIFCYGKENGKGFQLSGMINIPFKFSSAGFNESFIYLDYL